MAYTSEAVLRLSDVILATCTLLGAILTVRAQKWLEQFREKRSRCFTTYRTLMATRAIPVSSAHVEALNSIPIDFYHNRKVMDAWEEYVGHLSSSAASPDEKRNELHIKLLSVIGVSLGYRFNSAQLSQVFFPLEHVAEQEAIRRGVAALLKGEITLPMAIKEFPASPEAVLYKPACRRNCQRSMPIDESAIVAIGSDVTGEAANLRKASRLTRG
jgi:hypothetical protein